MFGNHILWMDKILHHFEIMVEPIVCWYLQKNHHSRDSEVTITFVGIYVGESNQTPRFLNGATWIRNHPQYMSCFRGLPRGFGFPLNFPVPQNGGYPPQKGKPQLISMAGGHRTGSKSPISSSKQRRHKMFAGVSSICVFAP